MNQPNQPSPPPKASMLVPTGRSYWAIAAGYLGLFGLIVYPAPLALIVSVIAIIDIQRSQSSPNPKLGMGRALFGLVVGVLGSGLLAWIYFTRTG